MSTDDLYRPPVPTKTSLMTGIDPVAFEWALAQVDDGFLFEKFGLDFLSTYLGYSFIPAGGIRDKGIDGFEHPYVRTDTARFVYQLSIDKDYERK